MPREHLNCSRRCAVPEELRHVEVSEVPERPAIQARSLPSAFELG
jgi:hypothetical protein